jgi:hypothetical protein
MMRDGAACPAQAEIDLAAADGSGEEGVISAMLPCAGGNPLDIAHADHIERGAFVGLRVATCRSAGGEGQGKEKDPDHSVGPSAANMQSKK